MFIDLDSSEVERVPPLVDQEQLATGHALWRHVNNDRAFLLVNHWARAAGRKMPELAEQTTSAYFDDVVKTLQDLSRARGYTRKRHSRRCLPAPWSQKSSSVDGSMTTPRPFRSMERNAPKACSTLQSMTSHRRSSV